MRILNKIKDLKRVLSTGTGNIGFVPTMGYLHEGHSELIRKSISENDITIVSIYVNPVQFGEGEDLEKYPRDIERDIDILRSLGVNVLFLPDNKEIYPKGYKTFVSVNEMDKVLCGSSRPGHFTGVATIVLKLINIVDPDCIYFGKKDAQQLIILKRMVKDLNLDVNIKSVDTKRERDGLALSSRNSYLSDEGRKSALAISGALRYARSLILDNKVTDAELIKKEIRSMILKDKKIEIDYVDILSLNELKKTDKIDLKNSLIALAVYVEGVRLIDNLIFGEL